MDINYIITKIKRMRQQRIADGIHPADVPWIELIRNENSQQVRTVMRQAYSQGLVKVKRTLNGHLIAVCDLPTRQRNPQK